VDVEESAETVKKYVSDGGYDWKFLLDTNGEVFVKMYRGNGYPTSVFIDTEGVIRGIRVGGMSRAILENRLNLIKTW